MPTLLGRGLLSGLADRFAYRDVLVATSRIWQTTCTIVRRDEECFVIDSPILPDELELPRQRNRTWAPGTDVVHTGLGRGWVWGAGRGVVTVRFETAQTRPGPVRSYADDDPALSPWLPEETRDPESPDDPAVLTGPA